MIETKETPQRHGVIFAIWDGCKIQLERRIAPGEFKGFTLIPGGKMELKETIEEALTREILEEYEVQALEYTKLGFLTNIEQNGILNARHVYLVTRWKGKLSNPEGKNEHLEVSLSEARLLCTHPVSQQVLDLVEKQLSGQNR